MNKTLMYLLSCILLITGILVSQGVDPGTENLTHSWTFNTESIDDTVAIDAVGGADGILMGDGAEGKAVIVDGSLFTEFADQWLVLPAQEIAINEYEAITLAVWYSSVEGANTGYTMLAYFGDTPATIGVDYYFLSTARGDDVSRAAISCGDSSTPWASETGANGTEYDDGQLHHMVSTLDDLDITLYLDGVLSQSTPLDTNNYIAAISTNLAYLSKGGYNDDATWMGEILDYKIYNKALSEEEVEFIFNAGPDTSTGGSSGIENKEIANLPEGYSLLQNYPNPFNPSTTISFSIPEKSFVTLKVYDVTGSEVATIVNGELSSGEYNRQWSPTNIASGVYFYRLQAGNFTASRKLLLIR